MTPAIPAHCNRYRGRAFRRRRRRRRLHDPRASRRTRRLLDMQPEDRLPELDRSTGWPHLAKISGPTQMLTDRPATAEPPPSGACGGPTGTREPGLCPSGIRAVMGNVPIEMLGERVGLGDQTTDVVTGQPVNHPSTLPAGSDQPGPPQPAQMLRHRRTRSIHLRRQGVHVLRPLGQQRQQAQPGRVGQQPKNLGRPRHDVVVQRLLPVSGTDKFIARAHGCIFPWCCAS